MLLGGEGDAAFGGRGRRGEVVGVIEAQAPVAEIAADDEDVGFVAEVRGEEGAVGAFGGGGGGAHEDGGEERRRGFWGRRGEGEEVGDVGEVHLEAVLGFIGGEGEGRELSGGAQGGEGGGVESEGAERGGVFRCRGGGEGAVGEVEVVGGAQEEDAFTGSGRVSGLGGDGDGGAGV